MNTLAKKTRKPRAGDPSTLRTDAAKLLWWAPVLMACAYVVFTPHAGMLSSLQLYDVKRLLEVGLLLAGAVCTVGVPRLRAGWLSAFRALPAAARWGLGGVLALGMISALTAPVPRYGLLEVAHYVLLFGLGLAVASVCRASPRRCAQVLLLALGVGAVFYALLFLEGYATHLAGGGAGLWPAGDIGFGNKRFFNQFQSWTLPLLAVPLLMPSVRRVTGGRAVAFALVAFWWMLAFASGGRGVLLGLVVALAGTAFLFRKKAWPWLRGQLAAGAVGALGYGLLFQWIVSASGSIAERAASTSSAAGRLAAWQAAGEAFVQQPWLGLGPMHTAYASNRLWPTSHNAVVQFATEWGAPAALLLVGLAGWGLFVWCRQSRQLLFGKETGNANRKDRSLLPAMRVALTASMLAAGTHAMVSGVVVMPASQVMMALALGCALGLYLPRHEPSASALLPAGKKQWTLVVFLLAGAALLVGTVSPDVLSLSVRFAEGVFNEGTLRLPPRYWSYGPFGG